jgi:hypothetical protein
MMAVSDASRHDWLQGRGPELTLIGFQDDATGQILAAHFQLEGENTVGYLRSLLAMIATHGVPLSLYRDRHSIFQRNGNHWTLAEQLAGKQTPTQLGTFSTSSASRSPPTRPRPRAASSAPGAPARTACSANFVSPRPPLWIKPTQCWKTSAPTSTAASPVPPPKPPPTSAACPAASTSTRCLALHYQRVSAQDHTVTLGARSIALPPLPDHRGYAGETVELSHQLDGTLRVYRGDTLLLALPLPLQEHADPSYSPRRRKENPDAPHL